MILSTRSKKLEIKPVVHDQIRRWCRRAGGEITGGILIGRYSDDLMTAVIEAATPPPPDSKPEAEIQRGFYRGVIGLNSLLKSRWKRGQYYVGEWHSRPGEFCIDMAPSELDRGTMRNVQNSELYQCPEPILLITDGAGKMRVFLYDCAEFLPEDGQ